MTLKELIEEAIEMLSDNCAVVAYLRAVAEAAECE